MKIIITSRKYVPFEIEIDDEDIVKFNSLKWYPSLKGGHVYFSTSKGVYLHRYLTDAPKGVVVDHRDGDTLNNKKLNLRLCTHVQNVRNSKTAASNTTGYKGVCYDNYTNLWKVNIEANKKRISGGRFKSKNEAAARYNELAEKYFGEFASKNIIKPELEEFLEYKMPQKRKKA